MEDYEDIVRRWYNKIRPLFVNMLKRRFANLSYDDIDDLYQDAFIAVYENLQVGRVKENTSWSSYMIQIGLNLATKKLRRVGITDSIDAPDDENPDSQNRVARTIAQIMASDYGIDEPLYNDINALKILGEELGFTPEPCNSIIRLYYYAEMSMEEIATAINFKNATTAKSKKSQCMKTLADRVKNSFKGAEII